MKNRKVQIIIVLSLVVVAFVAVVAGLYFGRGGGRNGLGELTPDTVLKEKDLNALPKESSTLNLLVVGVDDSHALTDVIMYVQYAPNKGTARVLSIPRDTFLGEEYPTGKINNVYKTTESMEVLMQEVEERFLLPVDYYALITLESLGNIVDEMGGIEITLENDLYDNGVKQFSAGTQTLSGDQAKWFVRVRHAYVDADLGRINAQHDFLLAAMHKLQSMGKLQTLQLIVSNFNAVETDIPLNKLVALASGAYSIQEEDIAFFTVPGNGKMNGSYAVYEVDRRALAEILNEHFLNKSIQAEDLDFPAVTAPPPVASAPIQPEEDEGKETEPNDETDEQEQITEPIYPDSHDYDVWEDGDYDEWFEKNTIYPDRPDRRLDSDDR